MFGTKILEERKSEYNGQLVVAKSLGYGTYIQSNGLTQSGGIVETIWKQTLKQINHLSIQPFNNVLILGLGGGTVAKLIKKNWPETKITGVDIDPAMVELGKKYLGLDETNIEIKIGDAQKEFERVKKRFDLIIVDLYNGDEFPEKFETENYMRLVGSHLAKGGIAVFNRLYFGDKRPMAVRFGGKLEKVFTKVDWFYPEANLMLICKK